MNNLKYIFLVVLLLAVDSIYCQYSQINGQKTIGNLKHNFSYSVVSVEDGGYIILGDTETDTNSMDYFVTRLSATNEIIWQKTYGGSGVDRPSEIVKDGNNGFLIIGSTSSDDGDIDFNHGLYDYWLININANGDLIWQKTYGGSNNDFGVDVGILSNSEIFVGGNSTSLDGDVTSLNGGIDFWLIKLNETGEILWDKNYGGSDDESLKDLLVDGNSGLYLLGGSRSSDGDVSFNHGEKDVWLTKLSSVGELLWEKSFGGSNNEEGKVSLFTQDSSLIVGTVSNSTDGDLTKNYGLNDYWVFSIDGSGNLIWQRSFGGSRADVLKDILKTDDGFIIGGSSNSFDGNLTENKGLSDVWFVKIYSNGVLNWQTSYGGSGSDNCSKIIKGTNSSYLTANQSDSFDYDVEGHIGETDIWMLELCESYITKENESICEGDSLEWEGEYYLHAGNFSVQYESQCGLDSTRQLAFNVVNVPTISSISGPTLVTEFTNETYYVNETQGLKYIWFVDNGIFKDTVFIAQASIIWQIAGTGNIAVYSVRENLCISDTSRLEVYVSGVGVEEDVMNRINIYPNPSSNGQFIIQGNGIEEIRLFNQLNSELELRIENYNSDFTIDLSHYTKGIYLLKIKIDDKYYVSKIIYN